MEFITTSAEMQLIDRMTIEGIGIPGMVLMEKAALKMFDYIHEHFDQSNKIAVICGIGNNGGDGMALARMLIEAGYQADIQIVGNTLKASDQFIDQMQILLALGIHASNMLDYTQYDILVDAIFGVGLSREVGGVFAEAIERFNEADAVKIGCDAPSGICCTTGKVLGIATKCDITITFGYQKRGLVLYPGCDYAGKVIVADIGFPKSVAFQYPPTAITYTKADLALLPKRSNDSHKGTYGKVLVVAGTKNMAGAAYFCAKAAYMTGSGLVQILTAEENRTILQGLIPEAIMTTYETDEEAVAKLKEAMKDCKTAVIGPGLSMQELTKTMVKTMLAEYEGKLIIDADGCNVLHDFLPELKASNAQIIITPHMKEASRILDMPIGDILENQEEIIFEFSKENGVVFVLKNARTLISWGERLTFINTSGNNGMSTGGSGDVLAGMIAGLCSGGLYVDEAARMGVFCHGLAGDYAREEKGVYSMVASDLLNHIPDALGGR